jgi:hypothetical protein
VAAESRPALVLRPARDYGNTRRYTWADLTVAVCALLVAGAVLLPALSYSKSQAQIASCQNNERQLGLAFHEHSSLQPDGSFPGPEMVGNRAVAGVYAPALWDQGFVTRPAVFQCAGAQSRRPSFGFRPPTLDQLDRAIGDALRAMHRAMGGDYGATLGYTENGQLRRPCNARRSHYALLVDAPCDSQQGRRSSNHGGRGQNVLFEDGRVQFMPNIPSAELPDDPFHNREGFVAAGCDSNDSSLGCSQDRPMPLLLPPGR